jgi:hypothetical protein
MILNGANSLNVSVSGAAVGNAALCAGYCASSGYNYGGVEANQTAATNVRGAIVGSADLLVDDMSSISRTPPAIEERLTILHTQP